MSAEARVRLLVHAANLVANDAHIVDALAAQGPLSRAGVELALREHLELSPSDQEIAQLVATPFPRTAHTTVVLAANVFVAALRALAVAAVSADRVHVRPSTRDPEFASALVHTARALGADWLALATNLRDVRGAVHVYGRSETIASIRAAVGPDVVVYAHGPGFSLAWVDSGDDPREAAALVARDMIPFDQRGCLSPRVVSVEGQALARELTAALHAALAACPIPRGTLDASEKAAWNRYLDTCTMAGLEIHEGAEHVVVFARDHVTLAPIGRAMHVVALESAHELAEVLWPTRAQTVAVAATSLELPTRAFVHVRRCALGELQRPRFDGPVDLRVLA